MDDAPRFHLEPDELQVFLQDVNEQLHVLESVILQLEQGTAPETLHAAFRAAHTLKAIAGVVGHAAMAELTHAMETLFESMRETRLAVTPPVADELLGALDVLKALRDQISGGQSSSDPEVLASLARLQALTSAGGHQPARLAPEPAAGPTSLTPDQIARLENCYEQGLVLFEITVAVAPGAFAPAARLLQAAKALAQVGQIVTQHPPPDDLLQDNTHTRLYLVLASQADTRSLTEKLKAISDLTDICVAPGLTAPLPTGKPALPAYEPDKTVRISVERLDTLMNLVGELVTDRTRLIQVETTLRTRYGKSPDITGLNETIGHLGQIVDQLQQEVMRTRMVPIAQLFNRFPRLVRDVARAAGKQVSLLIEGEATELDRSIIEAIGDPLIHLVRNAVDHGLEPPHTRAALDKPAVGTVRLTAAHTGGQILITIQDDGQGIDPNRVRRAAIRHGVLPEEEANHLSDDEAIALIFRPGLSTAEQVTDVSGRGVGLDIVRTNVSRIGGAVTVESQVGRGATFRVTLPLTLAIMPTMLVALYDDVYAIPLTSIIESLYMADVTVHSLKGQPAIRWRDAVLPLIDLPRFFGLHTRPSAGGTAARKPAIVAVAWGKLQIGLLVDKIIGKQEIVVKPFGPTIGTVPGLLGCTILGNGRIALILDIPGLIHTATQARPAHTHHLQEAL